MTRLFSYLAIALAVACGNHADAQGDNELLQDALVALRSGDSNRALELSTDHLERNGTPDPAAFLIRAQAHTGLEDYQSAAQDYEQLATLEPESAQVMLELGAAHFRNQDMEASVLAFDEAIRLASHIQAQLWQRGISQYYAGRFDDCANQFEIHRTVNPQDVENSVWHFLCVAASKDFDSAVDGLIPIDRDSRVPMMEVFALFGGKETAEGVLHAAEQAGTRGTGNGPSFYAHLYLGLYYEAAGKHALSAQHIAQAVRSKQAGNYMWQVARVHQALRTNPAGAR